MGHIPTDRASLRDAAMIGKTWATNKTSLRDADDSGWGFP